MNKKLVKYGNSYALVLNRSILELLDIDENDPVKLKIEGDTLLIKKSASLMTGKILSQSLILRLISTESKIHQRI